MLNSLNLDDRRYDDIREEAIRNIVKHAPSWSNHNASDPGIALVELFSTMTEMMQYRFNRVPDKNYMAFLDMLGINGNFVSPSASRVQFHLIENFEQHQEKKTTKHILAGTQFITKDKEIEDRPLIFETIDETYISNVKLKKIISKSYNIKKETYQFTQHDRESPFTPFQESEEIEESIIYLEDQSFSDLAISNVVTLIFSIDIKQSKQMNQNWFQNIKWEYSNGKIWKALKTSQTPQDTQDRYRLSSNAEHFFITLEGDNLDLNSMVKNDLSQKEGFYIRGRIDVEAHGWLKDEDIQIYEIHKENATAKDGIKPNKLLFNNASLDLNNILYPFGETPKKDDIFLIEDNIFSKLGQTISIAFKRSGLSSNLLRIQWEYPINKNEWQILKLQGNSIDDLKSSGLIEFIVPNDFHEVIVNGEKCFAIRAKITKEDYTQEKQKREDDFYKALRNQDENSINPSTQKLDIPYFDEIKISYCEPKQIIDNCYIYNNGSFIRKIEFNNEHKDNVKKSFLSEKLENDTSLYFGFDAHLQDDILDLFFEIKNNIFTQNSTPIHWEIYGESSWRTLKIIHDTSNNLNKNGDIRFQIPLNNKNETLFDLNGMWIRANFSKEKSLFEFSSTITAILQNSTIVYQQETLKNEFIGISIGIPNMKFKLNHKNVVYPPKIAIGEYQYEPIKRKKRFVDYTEKEYIYKFNSLNGEITFGDNQYGAIPHPKEDIYATQYAISYGEDGNIGKEELQLRTTIQSLDSVTNIIPATGGANAESLNDLVHRAPEVLRVKNRVVTVKDYEHASVDFSPYILKAKAISAKESDINIFVVTKDILEKNSMKEEVLLKELEEKLTQMSLVTVIPKVILAKTIQINIKIKLVSTIEGKKIDSEFKNKLEKRARDYFNITKKFPMGKQIISEADLYKILHQESFGYYYKEIKLWKESEHEASASNQLEINQDNEVIKLNVFEIED